MDLKLEFKEGTHIHGDKEAVLRELERIRKKEGGLSVDVCLKYARAKSSPLHEEITWDKDYCAGEHLKWQMRHFLGCVTFRYERENKPPTVGRYYYNVEAKPYSPGVYRAITEIYDNAEMYQELLRQRLERLQRERREYGHLKELQKIWDAIDEAVGSLQLVTAP